MPAWGRGHGYCRRRRPDERYDLFGGLSHLAVSRPRTFFRTAPPRSASVASAPVRSASVRSAPDRSSPFKLAPLRFAPVRSANRISARPRSAPEKFAPDKLEPDRSALINPMDWFFISAPIFAFAKLAPLRSNRLSRAMIRALEKLAPLKTGASAGEMSRPEDTTRPRRLAFDRSAFVKFARMIQARSSFAPERLVPERSAPTNFAPKRFAPDRFARLKSRLLRSILSSDFPERSAGLSGAAEPRISRTCAALRSTPTEGEVTSASNTHTQPSALFIPVTLPVPRSASATLPRPSRRCRRGTSKSAYSPSSPPVSLRSNSSSNRPGNKTRLPHLCGAWWPSRDGLENSLLCRG